MARIRALLDCQKHALLARMEAIIEQRQKGEEGARKTKVHRPLPDGF
jgi:hypothetical protein